MSIHCVFRSSFLYAWGLCLLVFAFHPAKLSAVGFRPISPEELKMTAEPAAPGAPAIILYQELYRDDDIKRGFEDNYFRIKILTEEGRKYADIEIPFERFETPWGEVGEEVRGIHARTIRPDGSIVDFDGKVFTKTIVKTRVLRYLAKTFTLPDVQVGSIIEYFYTVGLPEGLFSDSHWILSNSNELFTKAAKFSLKPYKPQGPVGSPTDLLDQDRVNITPTYYFRWTFQNIPPAALQAKAGTDQRIHMEASNVASSQNLPLMGREADRIVHLEVSNVPAFHTEDFMPPMDELKERIDFNYILDEPETDPKEFWSRVGERLDGKVEGFVGKRKALEKAVSEIVGPHDPPEEKLQKIYARVQQMRNTSYEVRKTTEEIERAKQQEPTSAEKAWKLGYASGGNLTWLYLALVRAAGFEAYGVVVANRQKYFFHPNMMQSQRLDTNLVLVKLNGKDFWCNPGAAFTPFGLLPWK
jgi:hypothetical protein